MTKVAIIGDPKSGGQVAKNLAKLIDHRIEIIESNEVRDGLFDLEYRVAEAGTRKPIKAMSEQELTDEIAETLDFIVRDLGIKKWTGDSAAYDSSRFFKMLRDYYFKLTYKQVELAFELLMVGKLDEWLPKKSSGEPDRGHYQGFDFQFVSKVLNAFIQYDRRLWGKAKGLLPAKPDEISDDDRRENHEYFINDIYKKFYSYRDEDVEPHFLIPALVIQEMEKQGVISGKPVVQDQTYELTKKRLENSNNVGFAERIGIIKSEGKKSEFVMKVAEIEENRLAIKSVFDELVRKGIDIEDVIKLDYDK